MTLQNLGNLGEFVGAIGVVVSLVYLGRQLVQNTKAVRAASFNSMVQNSIRLLEHAFRDSEFAAFLSRAEADPDGLSREERVRWDAYMTAVYRHFGNLVYAHRVGTLDGQLWDSYRATLKDHLRTSSWGAWFRENRDIFSTSLVDLVSELLDELRTERALALEARRPCRAAPSGPGPTHERSVEAPRQPVGSGIESS